MIFFRSITARPGYSTMSCQSNNKQTSPMVVVVVGRSSLQPDKNFSSLEILEVMSLVSFSSYSFLNKKRIAQP
jgi:hypothetical protein